MEQILKLSILEVLPEYCIHDNKKNKLSTSLTSNYSNPLHELKYVEHKTSILQILVFLTEVSGPRVGSMVDRRKTTSDSWYTVRTSVILTVEPRQT